MLWLHVKGTHATKIICHYSLTQKKKTVNAVSKLEPVSVLCNCIVKKKQYIFQNVLFHV